jgi:peroxiredoxin family protein
LALDNIKKKFDPVSAPSLVKTERTFRKGKLEKGEYPEIWITKLEELRLKLEDMESHLTDCNFMVKLFNILSNHYELKMILMEKCIWDKEKISKHR